MKLFDDTEFSLVIGKQLRDEGMNRASSSYRALPWNVRADDWLDDQVPGTEFTADDMAKDIGLPSLGQNQNNSVGAWFSAKSRQHRIVFTGRYKKSERAVRHINQNRVWRVL